MSSAFIHVTSASTVDEVLGQYPATAPVFHELGLDTCCGAHMSLSDAATAARTDLGVMLSMLEASACASFAAARRR
jgi:iron-sulfur cluster repair protein YtfE (RIC family)